MDTTPVAKPVAHPGPRGLLQFIALLTLWPAIYSFSLYWTRPVIVEQYYFQPAYTVDHSGTVQFSTAGSLARGPMQVVVTPLTLFSSVGSQQDLSSLYFIGLGVLAAFVWVRTAMRGELRQQFWNLMFGFAVLYVFAVVHLGGSAFSPGAAETLIWVVAPKITFLWFVLRGTYVSAATVWFALPVLASGFISRSMADWASFVFAPLLLFVLAALLIRIVVLIVTENLYAFRQMGWRGNLFGFAKAVVFWLPMALLSAPYFYLEHTLESSLQRALANDPVAPLVQRAAAGSVRADPLDAPRPIVLMMSASKFCAAIDGTVSTFAGVKRQVTGIALVTDQTAVQAQTELTTAATALAPNVAQQFESIVPPSIGFPPTPTHGEPESFGDYLLKPIHDLEDGSTQEVAFAVEAGLNKTYKTIRTRLESKLVGLAISAAGPMIQTAADIQSGRVQIEAGKQSIIKSLATTQNDMVRAILVENQAAQVALWPVFSLVDGLLLLSKVIFVLVSIKSFSYIFSRVAFHRASKSYLTLGHIDDLPMSGARISQFPGRYVLKPADASTYYAARRFQGIGRAPRLAFPQIFHAPIARILHHATAMNRLVFQAGDQPVTFTAPNGAHFVVWDLREGETVVFSFENFVAMAGTVKISTLISCRLSTLVLGRFIFSTATGPGELVLLAEGQSDVTDQSGESLPPDRLICMHRETRLIIESELNLADVYFSDVYVRPVGCGQVVVDVDRQTGGGIGLGRFFLHFLWPG